MGFKRTMIRDGGMVRPAHAGDGNLSAKLAVQDDTDANVTLTVSDLAAGLYIKTTMTVNRTLTFPSAALITAAFPEMANGEVLEFAALNADNTQVILWGAGAGNTIVGAAGVTALTVGHAYISKVSDAAYTIYLAD